MSASWCFLLAMIVLPLAALLTPLLMYLTTGWSLRRREIVTSFTDDAIIRYFETFFTTEYEAARLPQGPASPGAQVDVERLRREFDRHYEEFCGRSRFVVPLLLLVTIATGFLVYSGISVQPYLTYGLHVTEEVPAASASLGALAGFAGGYMWVVFFVTSRVQERRLSPVCLCWASFRLGVAVPVALSFTALFRGALTEDALYAVAFMLGGLPTRTLMTFMRRTAGSKLGLQESLDEPGATLTKLQQLGRTEAETFSEEGVESILQLAYADPIDLTVRTGFSFSYVVDCCSQALAWIYFEDDLPKLRRYSLRGAQEICTLVKELDRKTRQDKKTMDSEQKSAEATTRILASEVKMDEVALRRTFGEIAYDPYTQFLYDVWQSSWIGRPRT